MTSPAHKYQENLYLDRNLPIFRACLKGDIDAVDEILTKNQKLSDVCSSVYNQFPFEMALACIRNNNSADYKNNPLLNLLLDKFKINPWLKKAFNTNLIHVAASYASVNELSYLKSLNGYPGINEIDFRGLMPIHIVCMRSSSKITQEMRIATLDWLIAEGADLSARDALSRNAIEEAIIFGFNDIVAHLKPIYEAQGISFNANIDTSNWYNELNFWNRTPLHHAAFLGNELDYAKKILEAYPKAVDSRCTPAQTTPLIIALSNGFATIDFVKLLLTYGADLHAKYKGNNGVFHMAASMLKIDYLEVLINHPNHPDINEKNSYDQTALMAACMLDSSNEGEKIEVVDWLIRHGADFALRDKENKTAADIAKACGFEKLSEHLNKLQATKESDLSNIEPLVPFMSFQTMTIDGKEMEVPGISLVKQNSPKPA